MTSTGGLGRRMRLASALAVAAAVLLAPLAGASPAFAQTGTSCSLGQDGPAPVGGQLNMTLLVNPDTTGTPTGTVTFTQGTTTLTTAKLTGDEGNLTWIFANAGSYQITATFNPDTADFSGCSDTVTAIEDPVSTSTTVTSSLNPSAQGQPVTFTATFTETNGFNNDPGGTVDFADGGTTIGTGTVSAGSNGGTATFTTSGLAPGSHQITADYLGDTNDASSSSGALTQVVSQPSATTTTVSSVTAAYSAVGHSASLSATVTSAAGTVNEGAVAFTVVNSSAQTVGTATAGPVTNGTASVNYALPAGLAPGTYTIDAAYSDSAGNFLGSSGTGTLTVSGQPPSITSASSATFVAGTGGSFTVQTSGAPVASVTESGSLPSGVTLTDNGDGTATLAGAPDKGTKPGSYSLVITAANGVSPDAVQDFTLVVKDPVTVRVLAFPDGTLVGRPVLTTAVLSGGDSHGTVSFTASFDGGPAVPVAGCQNRSLFRNAALCLFTPGSAAGPGSYTVTASYSGDASHVAASGSASVQALARTSLALASSARPRRGSPVTVTAKVSPVPDGGTVSLRVTGPNGRSVAGCTAAPAGTGTASCTFTPAAEGTYHIGAVYSGDSLYFASAASLEVRVS